MVREALGRLHEWCCAADPVIARLEAIRHELGDLGMTSEMLAASGEHFPDIAKLREAGPTLSAHLYVIAPERARALDLPPARLERRIETPERVFLLTVATAAERARIDLAMDQAKARCIELPSWLAGNAAQASIEIAARIEALRSAEHAAERELEALHAKHDLPAALTDLGRLRWFSTAVPKLPETEHFAVITGWTNDLTGETLARALAEGEVKALIHFPPAPEHREPPVLLKNPSWARPFETFAALLGTPGRHESDPSTLLAVIAPLLFGFMFGDVGQGLTLALLGFLLRRRFPVLRLLIPGGLAAAGFGILFGSVFAREDVIGALWVEPLDHPFVLLGASVLFGALTLLLGLGLSGVQAAWRGSFGRWFHADAPLALVYLGLIGAVVDVRSVLLVVAGVSWQLIAAAFGSPSRRTVAVASAFGEMLERTLQLFVNTISFARVGAFALAHAGLSVAIVGLSVAAGRGAFGIVVLIVGNLFCILLEGLVVGIQTTRLVLFEFFVRFLRGEGRAFRPLAPPPRLGSSSMGQGVHAP